MNVLIVNQQENLLSSLNIEVIKTLRGTFDPDEIISTFSNFFFARMIIDITALNNCEDVITYQKLSIGLPIDKIILLIPANSQVANNFFLSKLISMGYYNFTTNSDGIMYLLEHPNTYKEVAHLHQAGMSVGAPMAPQPSNGISPVDNNLPSVRVSVGGGVRTLGIKNVTDNAGASSLIYMMKKELEETHNLSVLAIEIDKRDFIFFREDNMVSTDKNSLANELMRSKDFDRVLVDLNEYDDTICDDVIYLLEPSVIKLNRLMLRDKNIFSKLKGRKVIINKSTLSESDVREFSMEAGINIFYVLPPLNDRERSSVVSDLLKYLNMVQ